MEYEPYPYHRGLHSHFEQEVYRFLNPRLGLRYEPYVLRAGKYVYVPDFYVESGWFIEVKGRWNNYRKFKMMAQIYPILLIDHHFWRLIWT